MERRAIQIRGIVQGVGFRPFVYDLASRLQLHGFVRNHAGTVRIEVEGPSASLEAIFPGFGAIGGYQPLGVFGAG